MCRHVGGTNHMWGLDIYRCAEGKPTYSFMFWHRLQSKDLITWGKWHFGNHTSPLQMDHKWKHIVWKGRPARDKLWNLIIWYSGGSEEFASWLDRNEDTSVRRSFYIIDFFGRMLSSNRRSYTCVCVRCSTNVCLDFSVLEDEWCVRYNTLL